MITIAVVVIVAVALYLYNTRTFKYWEKRGIKHEKPIVFFGTNMKSFFMQKTITQHSVEEYRKYPNEKVVGGFRASTPQLTIRDPEIVKRILLTDFPYFHRRGMNPNKTVVERPIDARDMMARYTTDFIGACGFGLDANSLNEEDSEFRKLGKDIFKVTIKDGFVAVLKEVFPDTFKHLKYFSRVEKAIMDLVSAILKQRNYKPSGRNDFIDLMLECQKKGKMVAESLEKIKPDGSPDLAIRELTDELIAAQAFVFFAAGFETSSSATSYTLHQLAYNPEVQQKVQTEIDQVLARHNNKLSYEAVKEMTYLESAFKEAMRMFPSLGFLMRECARPYTIPELGVTIDEGVIIIIPLQALHNDPQYFEEPQEFRPERFLSGAEDAKTKFVYLPFGDGPRACIGLRLGLMQSIAGLAAVLSKFSVSPAPTTVRHPVVDTSSEIVQSVKGGLPLTFTKRKTFYA